MVAVLLVVAIVIVGALRLRAQNRGSPPRPGNLALKEKAALPLRSDVEDLYDMDDKNPDVIPCNKGIYVSTISFLFIVSNLKYSFPWQSSPLIIFHFHIVHIVSLDE